ncbi:hypothetical protein M407DRAFT_107540 [Tulasnella calospora MUT 4182]|uniref:Uncharacterized protein n=1 Tax=Tulasnella calospora MUT 4182 TaxID=1051891 RepID=A0A0C3QDK3_9AGAM|nr:hypothetical protein M407DRAFT_107540 [Tulasnella calospora MUT 4182]
MDGKGKGEVCALLARLGRLFGPPTPNTGHLPAVHGLLPDDCAHSGETFSLAVNSGAVIGHRVSDLLILVPQKSFMDANGGIPGTSGGYFSALDTHPWYSWNV